MDKQRVIAKKTEPLAKSAYIAVNDESRLVIEQLMIHGFGMRY
jgi:hypothetical protein